MFSEDQDLENIQNERDEKYQYILKLETEIEELKKSKVVDTREQETIDRIDKERQRLLT